MTFKRGASAVWKMLLADQAELDLLEITIGTTEKFGDTQADEYAETILLAIVALHDGAEHQGSRKEAISVKASVPLTWLVTDGKDVVFKSSAPHQIEVLRLLHDSMDLARHLPLSGATEWTLAI